MLVRHSPPVQYPVAAPPRPWPWALVLAVLLVLWWSIWAFEGSGFGRMQWFNMAGAALLFVGCVLVAKQAWRQWPQGELHWNGKVWAWQQGGHLRSLNAAPTVLLDVQWLLVLAWDCPGQGMRRFVVMKCTAAPQWVDLRRAVYSPVHPASTDEVAQAL